MALTMQVFLKASCVVPTARRASSALLRASNGDLHRASSTAYRRVVRMSSTAKFFVGGNWKCNGNKASIKQLVSDLNSGSVPADVDVVCAPPFVYLSQVAESLKPPFKLAAQNCWTGKSGAFTGEVSAEMLVDNGVPWVILGHSERRALCGETNEVVGQKVAYAQSQKLSVIACIGETLEQRESGKMFDVLDAQIAAIAEKVEDWSTLVIAYEPVWAIGTGVVATPPQAQEVIDPLYLLMFLNVFERFMRIFAIGSQRK